MTPTSAQNRAALSEIQCMYIYVQPSILSRGVAILLVNCFMLQKPTELSAGTNDETSWMNNNNEEQF